MIRCLLEPYKTDQPFSDKEKKPKPTRKKPSQDPKKPPPLPSSYKVVPPPISPFSKKTLENRLHFTQRHPAPGHLAESLDAPEEVREELVAFVGGPVDGAGDVLAGGEGPPAAVGGD